MNKSSRPPGGNGEPPADTANPEIRPGQSIEMLKELHILTRDGTLNQDSRRKLKQVNHLYQFIEPLLREVHDERADFTLVDHGAGKSYLGFILYDLFLKALASGRVFGIETRQELSDRSIALAQRLGFERMTFLNLSVREALHSPLLPQTVEIVTALHACDTATDDAIEFGIARHARHVVIVPCCQAEVAQTLTRHKASALSRSPLSELWRHPLHTREFGSQLTNVLRCLRLQAHGYRVTVTELTGWEHSMKNELIIATNWGMPNPAARRRLAQILEELDLRELEARFE